MPEEQKKITLQLTAREYETLKMVSIYAEIPIGKLIRMLVFRGVAQPNEIERIRQLLIAEHMQAYARVLQRSARRFFKDRRPE